LDVFVGDAPDGAAAGGEEEFFDGDACDVDAEEIGYVVEAVDEIGVEEEYAEEKEKVEGGEAGGADEHEGDEVAAEDGDGDRADGEGDDGVEHGVCVGLVRMPDFEGDEEYGDDGEGGVVAVARAAAQGGEGVTEEEFAND